MAVHLCLNVACYYFYPQSSSWRITADMTDVAQNSCNKYIKRFREDVVQKYNRQKTTTTFGFVGSFYYCSQKMTAEKIEMKDMQKRQNFQILKSGVESSTTECDEWSNSEYTNQHIRNKVPKIKNCNFAIFGYHFGSAILVFGILTPNS